MSHEDEAAIKKVLDAYADRLRRSDVQGIVELYTDDAALMLPDQETSAGTQQLTAAFGGALEAIGVDASLECEEIIIDGDLAAIRARGTGTMTVLATGEAMPVHDRELFVLRRVDGQWKIAQYMFQQMPGH